MEVYIEYLIIDNFLMDYLLLKTAFFIVNERARFWRLFLSAFISTVMTVIIPLLYLGKFSFPVKILTGIITVSIAARYKNFKNFLITLTAFISVTFLSGGALYYFKDKVNLNGLLLFVSSILTGFAFMLLSKKLFLILTKKRIIKPYLRRCLLTNGDTSVEVFGFMDTGNGLTDGNGGAVILLNKVYALKLFNPIKDKGKYLSLNTISGSKKIFTFKIRELKIYNGDEPNIFNNVTVGVSELKGDYDLLLHPLLETGVDYAFKIERKVS